MMEDKILNIDGYKCYFMASLESEKNNGNDTLESVRTIYFMNDRQAIIILNGRYHANMQDALNKLETIKDTLTISLTDKSGYVIQTIVFKNASFEVSKDYLSYDWEHTLDKNMSTNSIIVTADEIVYTNASEDKTQTID